MSWEYSMHGGDSNAYRVFIINMVVDGTIILNQILKSRI
jgi:hypothetical protein